jgi:2-polyprenyl-6-methoxyphenol hydroxylase-like FAD-dependent oxidoreductase
LVAADGRASSLRKALGITETHERISTMIGVVVDAALLPHAGHGHIFVGGPSPVLAYAIGDGLARVMVDVPLGSTVATLREQPAWLSGLPRAMGAAVLHALEREPARIASNDTRRPSAQVEGSAALIGDAGGCCHPVSASGIASGTHDARVLVATMEAHRGDVPAALEEYAFLRRPAQRTRLSLASALYRAFADRGPQMDALRAGLFRYWQESQEGAEASMSLLSTREPRMWVMAREYARVVGHGVRSLGAEAASQDGRGLGWMARAGSGLLASAWPHLQTAATGLVEDLEARLER